MANHQTHVDELLELLQTELEQLDPGNSKIQYILDGMLNIALDYRSPKEIAQRAQIHGTHSPTSGVDLGHDQTMHDAPTGDASQDSQPQENASSEAIISKEEIPEFLDIFKNDGCYPVTITDIYLVGRYGALNNVLGVVLPVNNFNKPFCVSGGYGRSIDRRIRCLRGVTDEEAWVIGTTEEKRRYVTRVISFDAGHRLDEAQKFDLTVSRPKRRYDICCHVYPTVMLGPRPTVAGRLIDLAVQQDKEFFGFRLSDEVGETITIGVVKGCKDVEVTPLQPRDEKKVVMSPFGLERMTLQSVYVPTSIGEKAKEPELELEEISD